VFELRRPLVRTRFAACTTFRAPDGRLWGGADCATIEGISLRPALVTAGVHFLSPDEMRRHGLGGQVDPSITLCPGGHLALHLVRESGLMPSALFAVLGHAAADAATEAWWPAHRLRPFAPGHVIALPRAAFP
jgi:hypothetical protein